MKRSIKIHSPVHYYPSIIFFKNYLNNNITLFLQYIIRRARHVSDRITELLENAIAT
jgi:hypothetical protein